jgi:hypothetical protein
LQCCSSSKKTPTYSSRPWWNVSCLVNHSCVPVPIQTYVFPQKCPCSDLGWNGDNESERSEQSSVYLGCMCLDLVSWQEGAVL